MNYDKALADLLRHNRELKEENDRLRGLIRSAFEMARAVYPELFPELAIPKDIGETQSEKDGLDG